MTFCASVDIGTNATRLLVAQAKKQRNGMAIPETVERRMVVTRLGAGVDETGQLDPTAIERTAATVRDFSEIWSSYGISDDEVRIAATSAARDAKNAEAFNFSIKAASNGIGAQTLTGEREARLAFLGATIDLPPTAKKTLVIDIGGGSTEFSLGMSGQTPEKSCTTQLGCVRQTERIREQLGVRSDIGQDAKVPPFTADQVKLISSFARQEVLKAKGLLGDLEDTSLIGVAGTVTTLAALAKGLASYIPEEIHGSTVSYNQVCLWMEKLSGLSQKKIESYGPVELNRGDILPAGLIILSTIMEELAFTELIASERDTLDGLCLELLNPTIFH